MIKPKFESDLRGKLLEFSTGRDEITKIHEKYPPSVQSMREYL